MENNNDTNCSEQKNVTMDMILSVFKNKKEEKTMSQIKAAIANALNITELFDVETDEYKKAMSEVERLIKDDKKLGEESLLRFTAKKKYVQRSSKPTPLSPGICIDKNYIGTAGEFAVMSELMFRGYNVNRMTIDDGIDIIATKDNLYYYIQVKTTTTDNDGKIYVKIRNQSFDKYVLSNMKYYIVVRCKSGNDLKNIFFLFTSSDIDNYTWNKYIKRSDDFINIKIKFHERSGEPILYDEKELNIGYNMNRFEL